MNTTQTKPTQPDTGPVLFDCDYRDFIWKLLEDLEKRDITISDLQDKVRAYQAKVDDLARRVR